MKENKMKNFECVAKTLKAYEAKLSPPMIIGVAGSVAAGKSTFSEKLAEALGGIVVSVDGFIFPNKELTAKGIMDQKGFPISFDQTKLVDFLQNVRHKAVTYPLYSQEISDVVPDRMGQIDRPKVLIVEGINILSYRQYLDYGIYLDATEADLLSWYLERFEKLLAKHQNDPTNFYYKYAQMDRLEALELAREVWRKVNLKNLHEYILPTKKFADMIIEKSSSHAINKITYTEEK
ncbi:MAG: type I pantothenate kinase [Lactobacillus sp.]|nr:type I pantothenate kinase [Lactobacillus sp.]